MLNLSSLVLLLISLVSTSGNDGLQQSSPFKIQPQPTTSALLAGGDEQDQYLEQDAAVEKIGQIFFPEFYVDGAIRSPPSIEVKFFADEDPVTFHKTSDLIGDQSYYWYGEAGDKSLNLLATAGSDGQTVIGSASFGQIVYNLASLPNGRVQIIERDSALLGGDNEIGTRDLKEANWQETSISTSRGLQEDGSEIDVMCLYTPRSVCRDNPSCVATDQKYKQTMDNLCNLSIQETNTAYQNSGVKTSLKLVYSGLISADYEEEGFMCAPVDLMKSSNQQVYANVRRLRDKYNADLVSLIVSPDAGEWCGCAHMFNNNERLAYSVVRSDCATGYYSFGHEIGHNLGCHHSPDNRSDETSAFGYQHPRNLFRTILAYECEGTPCPRIQRFSTSNQNYKYRGESVGDDSHNNAGRINDNAKAVANFRQRNGGVQGPQITNLNCLGNEVVLNVEISTAGNLNNVSWNLKNRKQNVLMQSSDFTSIGNVNACLWTGNCYSFNIQNSTGRYVEYKLSVEGTTVAQGSSNKGIITDSFPFDYRKKRFDVGSPYKKSCFWLRKKSKNVIDIKCRDFPQLRSVCPETCNSC